MLEVPDIDLEEAMEALIGARDSKLEDVFQIC